jgi:hypothetical protein
MRGPIRRTTDRASSREEFSSADATPDRWGGMELRTELVSGAFISPDPVPNSRKPGIRPA